MGSRWNRGDFVGSGHAQSMLVVGAPLLYAPRAGKPVPYVGPLTDPAFSGSVGVCWVPGTNEWQLVWRRGGRSSRVPVRAVFVIGAELARVAWAIAADDAGRDWSELDDDNNWPDTPASLQRRLIETYSDSILAAAARRPTAGPLRFDAWWPAPVDDVAGVAVLPAGTKRPRPLSVALIAWAVTELPQRFDEERKRREATRI